MTRGRVGSGNCSKYENPLLEERGAPEAGDEVIMKQITFKDIKEIVAELSGKGDSVMDAELELIFDEQPGISEFVMNRDELNDLEKRILLSTVEVGWYIVKKALGRNKEISEDYLYEQFDRNYVRYQERIYLKDTSESEFAAQLYTPNNQPKLIDYVVEFIMTAFDEPEKPVREQSITTMVVDAKTVIDCLVIDEKIGLAEICDKKYSDKSFKSVKETAAVYVDEFKKTSLYMKLKHKEKDDAESIITGFSEMMYNFFLITPVNWNARRVVECLTEIMPAKVMADDEYFMSVEPVMTAFMKFCADKGYVADGNNIVRRLHGITDRIMDEAQDEDHWGFGKSLLKEAESKGIDFTDKKQLESFIKEYNKEKGGLYQSGIAKKADKPGRNDPCPCGSGKKYKKCCGADE